MVMYKCEKCNYECNRKSMYIQHITRKTSCVPEEKQEQHIKNRTCIYCKKIFAKPNIMTNHMEKCKQKNETSHLLDMIEKLNNKIDKLETKPTNVTNNNITNNTYIQQNINVTPYGKEDISYLTSEDYENIFNKGCYAITEMVKYIHCNDKKPENRNIYIKNYKDDYILTFDGTDWNIERKDDILNNLIENKKNFLESKYDDCRKKIPKRAELLFQKFLNRSDNDEVINNIKDELKNDFYKNRHYVIKKPDKKPKKKKNKIEN